MTQCRSTARQPATRYWDGETLVVETTNLTEHTGSLDPSALQAIGTALTVTLTERFRTTAC